jgi:hypothetical protein
MAVEDLRVMGRATQGVNQLERKRLYCSCHKSYER